MESYARGPASTLIRSTIGAVFLENTSRLGERLAVVDREQDVRLSWTEYDREAKRTAAGLRGH